MKLFMKDVDITEEFNTLMKELAEAKAKGWKIVSMDDNLETIVRKIAQVKKDELKIKSTEIAKSILSGFETVVDEVTKGIKKTDFIDKRMRDRAKKIGKKKKMPYAESFRKVILPMAIVFLASVRRWVLRLISSIHTAIFSPKLVGSA